MNNPIGQSVERADGPLKLSGQAEFTGDIRLPGMLHGSVLHSPVAHARITSIDITADLSLFERYKYEIPVVVVEGGGTVAGRIDERLLRRALSAGA